MCTLGKLHLCGKNLNYMCEITTATQGTQMQNAFLKIRQRIVLEEREAINPQSLHN